MAEMTNIDWVKAPANTLVCKEKGIMLKDIVQCILDGAEKREFVMEELDLTDKDEGVEQLDQIMDVFVPVVNAWKQGGCGGDCNGCGGCCGGE